MPRFEKALGSQCPFGLPPVGLPGTVAEASCVM